MVVSSNFKYLYCIEIIIQLHNALFIIDFVALNDITYSFRNVRNSITLGWIKGIGKYYHALECDTIRTKIKGLGFNELFSTEDAVGKKNKIFPKTKGKRIGKSMFLFCATF